MTFSGRRQDTPAETENDQRHIAVVQRGVLAFYDAYLKQDGVACNGVGQRPKLEHALPGSHTGDNCRICSAL